MEENYQQRRNKKTLLAIVGIAVLVVAVVGVTYAFFNYTRTGSANTIRVGRIAFNTTQTSGQNGVINLSNVFPIARSNAGTDTDNVGEVTIAITGDTDYVGGVEYLVTATGVTNTAGGKTVPISVIVTPSSGLGTESSTYYTARDNALGSIYKVEAGEAITNNGKILVGYIKQNSELGTTSGINGTITIKAFLDKDLIAISDTVNGPVGNETDPNWVNGRTVLTTSEWESLRTNGLSFQVKVEANEGLWVKQIPTMSLSASSGSVAPNANTTATITTNGDGALSCTSTDTSVATCSVTGTTLTIMGVVVGTATITVNQAEGTNYTTAQATYTATVTLPPTCPGEECVYTKSDNRIGQAISGTLGTDYKTSYTDYGNNFFAHILNNGVIEESYACGINANNNNAVFCLRGGVDESSLTDKPIYTDNVGRLNTAFPGCNATTSGSYAICSGSVSGGAYSSGNVNVNGGSSTCYLGNDGDSFCE